jgi:CHASE2 domain-containing sensor protein
VWAPSELKQPCPTIQTVPLIELLAPGSDADASQMIKGKLVLFGADVIGGDVYPTPINDALPGVYVHAMALKNLMAFGDRYLRTTVTIWSRQVPIAWIFEVSLAALVVSLFGGHRHGKVHELPLIEKILKMLLHDSILGLLTMALALMLSAALMPSLRLAPLNWVGVGALAVLTREIIHWFPVDEWAPRQLKRLRSPAPQQTRMEGAKGGR